MPETVPHSGFDIQITITKTGIPATGFFRLLMPSGFSPQATNNENVSFTKLGHRYEYDFILPMNEDSTNIPIHIQLNEIEKGTFPVLIQGEIMDQKGSIFPIKFANYIEILSEKTQNIALQTKEQKKLESQKNKENIRESVSTENVKKIITKVDTQQMLSKKTESQKQIESPLGTYRIQIMAGRKKIANLAKFKTQHKITEDIFISQADGWYRYTLYTTKDSAEANRLCSKVRRENKILQAFVTYYKNGKRVSLPASQTSGASNYTKLNSSTPTRTPSQPILNQSNKNNKAVNDKLLLYRIEIAIAYDQPIPIYLLKNKVGKEPIIEFKHNQNYYYTVGEFENLEIARAFLEYVKTQFKFETAKIVQYQKDKRIKVII
jgi:hypothetical protein